MSNAKATKAVKAVKVAKVTKASIVSGIFAECLGLPEMPARKDILARIQTEAKLSAKGAATYLQNVKAKCGFIPSRIPE